MNNRMVRVLVFAGIGWMLVGMAAMASMAQQRPASALGPVAPTNTPTDTPTNTPVAPTNTPTDTPTNTPVAPTNTPTDTPTNTPVAPTNTPTSTPTNTPIPVTTCLTGAGANEMTTILGRGMGSNSRSFGLVRVVVPDNQNVISIYGQVAGQQQGKYKYARFIRPNGTYINDKTQESPAYRPAAIFWFGHDLTPTNAGRWRARLIGASVAKPYVQRAFLLYPTYETTGEYVNVFQLFADSSQNHVYWDVLNGWTPIQNLYVSMPPPQLPADLVVMAAVVDNDADTRPFKLTITAGGVSQSVQVNGPTHGDLLNIIQVSLPNVPAGTTEIEFILESPDLIGDSVALVGMTAHYACVP